MWFIYKIYLRLHPFLLLFSFFLFLPLIIYFFLLIVVFLVFIFLFFVFSYSSSFLFLYLFFTFFFFLLYFCVYCKNLMQNVINFIEYELNTRINHKKCPTIPSPPLSGLAGVFCNPQFLPSVKEAHHTRKFGQKWSFRHQRGSTPKRLISDV